MPWQPLDCHAHTVLSDGELTVAELAKRVRARGVRPSVSDHLSSDAPTGIATVDAVRAYLDELEQHDVARGGEFCWHDSLWRELPDDVVSRFSHRLGSLHSVFVPGSTETINMWSRTLPHGLTPDTYMEIHVHNLERFAREMPVHILAHPTLLPLPLRDLPPEDLWTEEREERVVAALAWSGIAFEVSARYRPHLRFVRRAYQAGVRLALGSDGHTADQVGDLRFPLAVARAAGTRDEELYDPFVHGSRGAILDGSREAAASCD